MFISVTLPTTPWLKSVAFVIVSAIVFVSVLVHEMGHALAARKAGLRPEVTLTWFGGFTRFVANVGPGQRLWISAAGVVLQAAMAGVVWLLIRQGLFGESELIITIAEAFVLFNLIMAGINLIPVGGMDGGAILGSVLELLRVPRPRLVLLLIYGVGGAAITLVGLARADWIVMVAGVYLTFVGLRSQLPYVRFEQDAMTHPELEATFRRSILRRRFAEAADVAEQALESSDSVPYLLFAATARLDAVRLSGDGERLRALLDNDAARSIDPIVVGRAHLAAGRYDEAIASLTQALADRSEQIAAVSLAEAHLAAGDPRAAVAVVGRWPQLFQPVSGLDLHARLVESGHRDEAAAVRSILAAQRDNQIGATAHMLIIEGKEEEGLAILQRDHELSATPTSEMWLRYGLRTAGRSDAPTTVHLPGQPDPAAAEVLVHLLTTSGDHEQAVAVGLPVVLSDHEGNDAITYDVAASLDAIGRVDEALDLLDTIPPGHLIGSLAEFDHFPTVRTTERFSALVERLAMSRL